MPGRTVRASRQSTVDSQVGAEPLSYTRGLFELSCCLTGSDVACHSFWRAHEHASSERQLLLIHCCDTPCIEPAERKRQASANRLEFGICAELGNCYLRMNLKRLQHGRYGRPVRSTAMQICHCVPCATTEPLLAQPSAKQPTSSAFGATLHDCTPAPSPRQQQTQ